MDANANRVSHGATPEASSALVVALFGLTFVTGVVDAVSFLGLGHVFTANMTGNVVILAFATARVPGLSIARSLTARQREEWLDVPHFEIVELHVRPASQRRGLGSELLAQLLTRQPHDRALLSTQLGSRKARGFYAKNRWAELGSVDFGVGYPPYVVLGKLLV